MDIIFNFLHNFASFIIILSLVVFVHEYGHYIAAKLCGVRIISFSIGMGKEIWGWYNKEGTRFKLSYLPLGGYVSMFGHNEFLSNSKYDDSKLTEVEKTYAFDFKTIFERIFIVVSGPLANFLMGFAIIFMIYNVKGYIHFPAKIGEVVENYPAYEAGMMPGDEILEINGQEVQSFADIQRLVFLSAPGETMSLMVRRENNIININLIPKFEEETDIAGYKTLTPKIGVRDNGYEFMDVSILESAKLSISEIYNIIKSSFIGITQIIMGDRSIQDIGGAIKIAHYSGKSVEMGFYSTLRFIALISINLGFINLLPIPCLDGGYIALYLIEGIIGKKNSKIVTRHALKLGVLLIIGLFTFTTINDIYGLINIG